jgi:hypothetical protein
LPPYVLVNASAVGWFSGRGALCFQLFFAEVRDGMLASGLVDAATFDHAAALLNDPTSWTQCWMMTAVWGRKAW